MVNRPETSRHYGFKDIGIKDMFFLIPAAAVLTLWGTLALGIGHLAFFMILSVAVILTSYFDLKFRRIPNEVVLITALAAIPDIAVSVKPGTGIWPLLMNRLFWTAVSFVVLFLFQIITKGIGGGDSKFCIAATLFLAAGIWIVTLYSRYLF